VFSTSRDRLLRFAFPKPGTRECGIEFDVVIVEAPCCRCTGVTLDLNMDVDSDLESGLIYLILVEKLRGKEKALPDSFRTGAQTAKKKTLNLSVETCFFLIAS
jgi:hypothetical protein